MATEVPPGTAGFADVVVRAYLVGNRELALVNAFMEKNRDIIGFFILDRITAAMAQSKPGLGAEGKGVGEELDAQYKAKIADLNRRGFLPPVMMKVLSNQDPAKLLQVVAEPWRKWCSE